MTRTDFQHAMNLANRYDAPCFLLHEGREVVAVGLDSARSVAILDGDVEVPLRELCETFA